MRGVLGAPCPVHAGPAVTATKATVAVLLVVAFLGFLLWQAHPLDHARARRREADAADKRVAAFKARQYDISHREGRPE